MGKGRNDTLDADDRSALAKGALLLSAMAFLLLFFFVFAELSNGVLVGGKMLIVASVFTSLVLAAPSYYEYRRGRFDLFHPLTFAAWSYLLPAFCIGGFVLAFGLHEPFYLSFISDPEIDLPLSLLYVCLGFTGMVAGFYIPWNRAIVGLINRIVPRWSWSETGVWGGGALLVAMGFALNIIGFFLGLIGYQRVDQTGQFDAVIVFLSIFFAEGTILLWLAFFSQGERKGLLPYLMIVLLLLLVPVRVLLMGSRGELMLTTISIGMAFWYSGRIIKKAHALLFVSLVALSLVVGVVWATTFRNIKGSEARMSSGDYVGQIVATADYLAKERLEKIAEDNLYTFLSRIETLSSLGVIVSNYERLAPYEEAYGLSNNIVNDLMTAFIPRVLWSEKPSVSDPRAFGDLYFSYSGNSFAVTPFGDLLRNFGSIGVFLGMLVVGIYMKVIYSVLIEAEHPAIWKKMIYFPLLSVFSFEGFYSMFAPSLVRVFFVSLVSILLLQFLIGRSSKDIAR